MPKRYMFMGLYSLRLVVFLKQEAYLLTGVA